MPKSRYDRRKLTLPIQEWLSDEDLFWQEVPEDAVTSETLYEKLDEWLRNFKVNYNTIGFDYDVKTLKPIKGSAVVVDKSMASTKFFEQVSALKNYEGTIIACDRAVPTLIHAGIVPDIVCQIDSSYLCQYFFDVPEVKAAMHKMTGVFATTTHPLTIRLWHGHRVFFQPWLASWQLTWTLAKKAGVSIMSTGGQVACQAWLLAVNLQANPIGVFGVTNCFDEKTEILTEKGWRYFSQLERGIKVCTLNRHNGVIEYQKPIRYIAEDYEGKMVRIKSLQGIDLLVTPNHRFWVKYSSHGNNIFKFVTAKNLRSGQYIPCTGKWIGVNSEEFILPEVDDATYTAPPIKMDDWVRFFGIWLAEGWCLKSWKHSSNAYRVGIDQSEKHKEVREEIRNLLKTLPFHFLETKKGFVTTNKQLWTYLRQFGDATSKFIPQEIKNLPPKQLSLLLNWMMKGDGYTSKSGVKSDGRFRNVRRRYITSSKQLADDVQELALKIGLHARIISRQPNLKQASKSLHRQVKSVKPNYVILFRTSKFIGIRRKQYSSSMKPNIFEEYYKGRVYCVEVPNQIIYVRRNGMPVWTGNSYDDINETEYPGVRHEKVKNKYGTFWVDPVYEYYNAAYLAFIEYAKKHHKVSTVNCTKGGILYSKHVEDMSLEEFVRKYK